MPRFATFPGWLLLAVGACATATGAPRHAADAGAAADARAEMDEREVGAPARGFEPGPLWGPLRSGPYGVGYRSWLAVDESRGAEAGATGRPIEFMLWYPAAPSDGEPLAFGAYFEDAFPDDWTAPYRRALAERDLDVASRQFAPPSDSLRDLLFGVPTAAVADAEPAFEGVPLVVHAGGRNNFQQEGTVMWEYLASHGYAVVVIPQFGPSYEQPRVSFTLEDLQTQALDVLHARRASSEMGFIDAAEAAVLGHSSGSVAGLLAAARDPRIDMLIGLDGSTTTGEGAELLAGVEGVDDLALTLVELYARGKQDYSEAIAMRMTSAPAHLVGIGGGVPPALATHFDFQMWPVIILTLGQTDERARAARPEALGAAFYWTAARLVRAALDARAAGEDGAALTLAPHALSGVELQYDFRPAGR
jgi:hypothetical protein